MPQPVVRSYCRARPRLSSVRNVARSPSKPRNFRVSDDLWEQAMDTAAAAGENLPDKLRDFLRWYTRQPGARQPTRPASPQRDTA